MWFASRKTFGNKKLLRKERGKEKEEHMPNLSLREGTAGEILLHFVTKGKCRKKQAGKRAPGNGGEKLHRAGAQNQTKTLKRSAVVISRRATGVLSGGVVGSREKCKGSERKNSNFL